jgi:hypothetical protein
MASDLAQDMEVMAFLASIRNTKERQDKGSLNPCGSVRILQFELPAKNGE